MTIYAKYLCKGDKIGKKEIKKVSANLKEITVIFKDGSKIIYNEDKLLSITPSKIHCNRDITCNSRYIFEKMLEKEYLLQKLADNVEIIKTDRWNQIESATITLNKETLDFFIDYLKCEEDEINL